MIKFVSPGFGQWCRTCTYHAGWHGRDFVDWTSHWDTVCLFPPRGDEGPSSAPFCSNLCIVCALWNTQTSVDDTRNNQTHFISHLRFSVDTLSKKPSDYLLIRMHHEQTVCCWVNSHGGDSRTVYRNCAMSLKHIRSLLIISLLSNVSLRLYKYCDHITHLPCLQVVDVNLVVIVCRGQPFAILADC